MRLVYWKCLQNYLIKGVVLTIQSKNEHKIKELKDRIEHLENENYALKQQYNLSDNENNYDEYENFKLERKFGQQTEVWFMIRFYVYKNGAAIKAILWNNFRLYLKFIK